jgi:hypothetical protein
MDSESWFRDSPHYWAEASLPLAYAVACVEVVSRSSEKARASYNRIIETWGSAGMKGVSDKISSVVPESEKEKVKNALAHPESGLLPDPNRPFKDLEKVVESVGVDREFFEVQETAKLQRLISEFIIVGFNRECDIEKGRYTVIPNERAPWLIWAVAIRTVLESYKITFDKVRDFYKVRRHKGKIVDFHKVLSEQPMSRLHRQMVRSSKAIDLKLKNDRTIVEAARRWYECRVGYPSIKEFCDAKSRDGISLELQNVDKQIEPCDNAVGYIRRLPRRASK